MSNLLFRFRQQYPQGSLCCNLLQIDRGLYLVQASVTLDGIVLGTALAAQPSLEAAEDSARERVLATLNLSAVVAEAPPTATVESPTQSPNLSPPIAPSPASAVQSEPSAPNLPPPLVIEPEAPPTPPLEISPPQDMTDGDHQAEHHSSQLASSVDTKDTNALSAAPATSAAPSIFDQPTPTTKAASPIVDTPPDVLEEPIDFSEIIARSNLELKRLGWTSEQGRNYLLQTYGKRSRQLLSDEQLIEFLAYLEQQPTPD
ncbi:MAG: hypothetical protein RLZZ568_1734 [Cyanobacteriota bacterium]